MTCKATPTQRLLLTMTGLTLLTGCPPITDGTGGGNREFEAQLSGANEVPPVSTTATGDFEAQIAPDEQSITFRLETRNIANVTAAHIHVGAPGVNGPIILFLFNPATKQLLTQCFPFPKPQASSPL